MLARYVAARRERRIRQSDVVKYVVSKGEALTVVSLSRYETGARSVPADLATLLLDAVGLEGDERTACATEMVPDGYVRALGVGDE